MIKGISGSLLYIIRDVTSGRIDDAVSEERIVNIEKATRAMLESGVDKSTVVQLLQKHWDMRLSEATECVEKCNCSI